MQFRWDLYNALNHQNLGVPNGNWCLPPNADGSTDAIHVFGCQFGKITNIQTDPRSMQFGIKFSWQRSDFEDRLHDGGVVEFHPAPDERILAMR